MPPMVIVPGKLHKPHLSSPICYASSGLINVLLNLFHRQLNALSGSIYLHHFYLHLLI